MKELRTVGELIGQLEKYPKDKRVLMFVELTTEWGAVTIDKVKNDNECVILYGEDSQPR